MVKSNFKQYLNDDRVGYIKRGLQACVGVWRVGMEDGFEGLGRSSW